MSKAVEERAGVLTVLVNVNGRDCDVLVEPNTLLVHALREGLRLTGTHVGCDTSQCGACTVHLDGKAVKSCTMFAVQAEGHALTTIEGIGSRFALHPVQEAFWLKHGLQCGFCTPGMIMSTSAFLKDNPDPSDDEIRRGIDGNICRCTGYENIIRAVQSAARSLREGRSRRGIDEIFDAAEAGHDDEHGTSTDPEPHVGIS